MSEMDISPFKTLIIAAQGGNPDAMSQVLAWYRNSLRLLARLHVTPLLQSKFDESDNRSITWLRHRR